MGSEHEQVALIATKLTKAQRHWLLHSGYVDPNTLRALRRKGLKAIGVRGLTDLGHAVRAHLQSKEV